MCMCVLYVRVRACESSFVCECSVRAWERMCVCVCVDGCRFASNSRPVRLTYWKLWKSSEPPPVNMEVNWPALRMKYPSITTTVAVPVVPLPVCVQNIRQQQE
jgi:hypothetical protein